MGKIKASDRNHVSKPGEKETKYGNKINLT